MKKRVFSAEFKVERVLEVLRGEKEINEKMPKNTLPSHSK